MRFPVYQQSAIFLKITKLKIEDEDESSCLYYYPQPLSELGVYRQKTIFTSSILEKN